LSLPQPELSQNWVTLSQRTSDLHTLALGDPVFQNRSSTNFFGKPLQSMWYLKTGIPILQD